jgi:hypothetical protein
MNEQLERDISRKLSDRLTTIGSDHISLCKVAGIGGNEALAILFAVLGSFLIEGVAMMTNMPANVFAETMGDGLRQQQRKNALRKTRIN